MKVLFVSDDMILSQNQLEGVFVKHVFPIIDMVEEIAILNPNPVELYAIKIARKLNIPYLGFLADTFAAMLYADEVFYVTCGMDKLPIITECEFHDIPVSTFKVQLAA